MNIRDATLLAQAKDGWLRKRDRTEKWCLYVAAGSVFRNEDGEEVSLDARDCRGDDWYVVDASGAEIPENRKRRGALVESAIPAAQVLA